jgi:hypothetical protein
LNQADALLFTGLLSRSLLGCRLLGGGLARAHEKGGKNKQAQKDEGLTVHGAPPK